MKTNYHTVMQITNKSQIKNLNKKYIMEVCLFVTTYN